MNSQTSYSVVIGEFIMKHLKKSLSKLGCTEFDIDATQKATKFLIGTFFRSTYHYHLIRQTKILMAIGGMTDEEWILSLELQWETIFPQFQKYIN